MFYNIFRSFLDSKWTVLQIYVEHSAQTAIMKNLKNLVSSHLDASPKLVWEVCVTYALNSCYLITAVSNNLLISKSVISEVEHLWQLDAELDSA